MAAAAKEVSFPLKRFLCVVCIAALLVFCAACGRDVLSDPPAATAAPTASSSRNVRTETARSEPVTVTETHADSEAVSTATAAPSSESGPVDTPATGGFSVGYFVAVLGLILISAAGLLMLRRI